MAFVPDGVIARARRELSDAAGALYFFHCEHRNHEARVSRAELAQFRVEFGVSRSAAYAARAELLSLGWIKEVESGAVVLMVGDFKVVNEAADKRKAKRLRERSLNLENSSSFQDSDSSFRAESSSFQDSHNKEGTSLNQPVLPALNQPPPQTPPGCKAHGGGGCLSEFSEKEILEFALEEKGIVVPDKFAEARHKDGRADARVRAYMLRKSTPAPAVKLGPLTMEDQAGAVLTVVGMLQEGRTIESIDTQLGGTFTKATWATIRSVALAQFNLKPHGGTSDEHIGDSQRDGEQ